MHGPLGEAYLRVTNFKDVAAQVSNHYSITYTGVTKFLCQDPASRAPRLVLGVPPVRYRSVRQVSQASKKVRSRCWDCEQNQSHRGSHRGDKARSGDSTSWNQLAHHPGSEPRSTSIRELLGQEGNRADPVFAGFCSRVSRAVQLLSSDPADTVAINDSQQVRHRSFLIDVISRD